MRYFEFRVDSAVSPSYQHYTVAASARKRGKTSFSAKADFKCAVGKAIMQLQHFYLVYFIFFFTMSSPFLHRIRVLNYFQEAQTRRRKRIASRLATLKRDESVHQNSR